MVIRYTTENGHDLELDRWSRTPRLHRLTNGSVHDPVHSSADPAVGQGNFP